VALAGAERAGHGGDVRAVAERCREIGERPVAQLGEAERQFLQGTLRHQAEA
jgi:hypothetical protein